MKYCSGAAFVILSILRNMIYYFIPYTIKRQEQKSRYQEVF